MRQYLSDTIILKLKKGRDGPRNSSRHGWESPGGPVREDCRFITRPQGPHSLDVSVQVPLNSAMRLYDSTFKFMASALEMIMLDTSPEVVRYIIKIASAHRTNQVEVVDVNPTIAVANFCDGAVVRAESALLLKTNATRVGVMVSPYDLQELRTRSVEDRELANKLSDVATQLRADTLLQ